MPLSTGPSESPGVAGRRQTGPERERRDDKIGEILISEVKITGEQLEQALELQKRDQ
jgi:hypothetical protein